MEDPKAVKNEIKRYFENRFKEEENLISLCFEGINFKSLNELQASKLGEKFTETEIKEAIWNSDGNKSPGPDRYNFAFIKAC